MITHHPKMDKCKTQLSCVQIYLLHFDHWVQITSTLNQQIFFSMSLEKSLNLADFSEKPSPTNNFYFIFILGVQHCIASVTQPFTDILQIVWLCAVHSILTGCWEIFYSLHLFISAVDFSIALNTSICCDFQCNFQFEMTL